MLKVPFLIGEYRAFIINFILVFEKLPIPLISVYLDEMFSLWIIAMDRVPFYHFEIGTDFDVFAFDHQFPIPAKERVLSVVGGSDIRRREIAALVPNIGF